MDDGYPNHKPNQEKKKKKKKNPNTKHPPTQTKTQKPPKKKKHPQKKQNFKIGKWNGCQVAGKGGKVKKAVAMINYNRSLIGLWNERAISLTKVEKRKDG